MSRSPPSRLRTVLARQRPKTRDLGERGCWRSISENATVYFRKRKNVCGAASPTVCGEGVRPGPAPAALTPVKTAA